MWYAILDKERIWEELHKKVICERMLTSLPFTPPFRVIAFPEEELAKALDVMNYKGNLVTTPTSHPKLKLVLIQPITVLLQRGDNASSVEEALRIYSEELGLPIVATNPHGRPISPLREGGAFHLRFFSRPDSADKSQHQQFKRVFGRVLPTGVSSGLEPSASGGGVQLRAPEGVIAELHGENLYVLFDLPHPSSPKELTQTLLARILELCLDARRPKLRSRSTQARYVDASRRARRVHLAHLQGCRQDLIEQIGNLEGAILRRKEELRGLDQQLDDYRRSMDMDLAQEFERLKGLPHVKQVGISGSYLHLHTDEIYLQDKGKTYLMGKYLIKIPLEEGPLSIKNKNPKRREDKRILHHPHVTGEEGHICLGNISGGVLKHLTEGRYELVAQALIEFLHRVNPHDSFYSHLKYWKPLDEPRPCPCRLGTKARKGKERRVR